MQITSQNWNLELISLFKEFSFDAGFLVLIILLSVVSYFILKKVFKILIFLLILFFLIFCFYKTPLMLSNPFLSKETKKYLLSKENSNAKNILVPLVKCNDIPQAIVVLGAGINRENIPSIDSQYRILGLNELISIIDKKQKKIPIFFTGGLTNKFVKQSEAESMVKFFYYLQKENTHSFKIYKEEKSLNTYQNALYLKELFEQQKIQKDVYLLTSTIHMFRAQKVFKKMGFTVCPVLTIDDNSFGSGFFNFSNAKKNVSILNEYFGTLGYFSKGWLDMD